MTDPMHRLVDFHDASTTPARALDGALATVVHAARNGVLVQSAARTFLSTLADLGYGITVQPLTDPLDSTVTAVNHTLHTLAETGDATTTERAQGVPAEPVVTAAPVAPWSIEGIRNRGVVLRFTGADGQHGLRRGRNYNVAATEGAAWVIRMTEPAVHVYSAALTFWNEWSVAE